MTSLHIACKLGFAEAAALLLENEADLESRTKSRKTPLH